MFQKSFDIFNTGKSMWKSDFGDSFENNIRKYIEECDSMQGFNITLDCTDGFAGLALGCIELLADEYTKPILAYPIIASHFPDNDPNTPEERDISTLKDSTRLVNIALAVQELSEYATMFVPLCTSDKGWRKPGNPRMFDHISYKPEVYHQSSALLASALDTLSQKYRHKSNSYTLSDICGDMTGYGRKMAAASLGMPFAFCESKYLIEHLNETTRPIFSTITPSCKLASDKIFQVITVRGIPESHLKPPPNSKQANELSHIPAYRCGNIKEMFELYFQANNFLSATNVTVCKKPIQVGTPYPKFFSENLTKYGSIKAEDSDEEVESCAVVAGYHNGNFMANMLEKLHREVSRIQFAKLHRFREEGLETADYRESLNKLSEFKDNYEDHFEL